MNVYRLCHNCGCLLPPSDEMQKKFPHKCWVILTGYLPPGSQPPEPPEDDTNAPFYEWPEPT